MKTIVKITTVLLYLLCIAALFMPYHIDALSEQPVSGMDLMFGYSIHDNPIKGEWIFAFIFLAPPVLGAICSALCKVGGFASVVNFFIGFGMTFFNYFMNAREDVRGSSFSMIVYILVIIVSIAGFVIGRLNASYEEEIIDEPHAEINPMDAPPKKYGPLKTPEPFVKNEASSVKIEPIKRPEPPKPSEPGKINVSSIDKLYNQPAKSAVSAENLGETKVLPKKEETDYEEFYHKPMDFDYFLEKYKNEHKND